MIQKRSLSWAPEEGGFPSKGSAIIYRACICILAVAQARDQVVAMGIQVLLSPGKQRDIDGKNVRFKVQVGD